MREIKSRGKDNHGTWRYGYLVCLENNPAIYFQVGNGEVKRMDWVYVKPESVGQFTGLYDKDGKEIYEGDVIEAILPHGETRRHLIVYDEKEASFKAKHYRWQYPVTQIWIEYNKFSVVGNLIDYPNLLKQP